MDVNYIPEEFAFSHDLCFFLHDILVDIIKSGEEAHIFSIHIDFQNEADAKLVKDKQGDDLWAWLEEHGYKDAVSMLSYKQVCVALLSDFCHFVHEALQCSRKGKLTVTFALLRKPFKDNLLYLEWLLADPADFLKHFRSTDMGKLFNKTLHSSGVEKRKMIIQKAIQHTKYQLWLNSDMIYTLRYDKKAEWGLEMLFQKATHLVTTLKPLETESQNFNFVFSGEEEHYAQWGHLYSILPMLLFHAVQVVEALIATFATRVNTENDITEYRALIGLYLWAEDIWGDMDLDIMKEQLKIVVDDEPLMCKNCSEQIVFNRQNLYSFYNDGSVTCHNCNNNIDLLIFNDKMDVTRA